MFTIERLKAAHSKVKSGADFPGYVQNLSKLGVTSYETSVIDGHTDYYGKDKYKASTTGGYEPLLIADNADIEQFKKDLKAHQQGKTGYPTFCSDCAKRGVEKWVVCMERMTCTYFDKAGNEMLVETIPAP